VVGVDGDPQAADDGNKLRTVALSEVRRDLDAGCARFHLDAGTRVGMSVRLIARTRVEFLNGAAVTAG